jgi:hypothetical protein
MAQPGKRPDYLLGNTLNDLFMTLPKSEIQRIAHEVHEQCTRRGITYVDDDNSMRVIPLMLRPTLINPIQRSYFHYVSLQVIDALKKLCARYIADPEIRRLLPMREDEEAWLLGAWGRGVPRFHTILSRLDANTDFTADDWRENFQFFEANSVGIGGLHYTTISERIILDVVGPRLKQLDSELHLELNGDTRELLLDELKLHARAIGRPRCNIAFLDDPKNIGGITEYPHLAEHFYSRGHQAVVADPRLIYLHNDELCYRGIPIDVIYRDIDVKQCIEIEKSEGKDLSAIRTAFQRNQVVSSLAGDFDHKSCWELFSDDRFGHFFTPAQWRIFNRHILWTRLIRETKTTQEAGRTVDLVPYVRNNRESLVVKPNRQFGGVGVTIGPETTAARWDEVIQEAVTHPYTYVVQRYTPVHSNEFPVLHPGGEVSSEEFFVNSGFYVTANAISLIGRASKKSVVNVAQAGGLTTVLMILDQQRL